MFNGSAVALITPFTHGGLDLEALNNLIDFHLENSTQALVILGTTGEAATTSFEEREEIIKTTIERVNNRIPVIVGVGLNSTEASIKNINQAESLGADGLLIVTPYYNKATQKGLVAHYEKLANSTKLPIILYNVPGRTGVNLQASTVGKLSQIPNIIGIKEASGDISQILEIKRLVPEDFKIYSGNDDQIVPIYSCGGHGVISVLANIIPRETQLMCKAFEVGDFKNSLSLQLQYKRLIDLIFCEVNPIPVKAALAQMNMCNNLLRLPLTSMEEDNQNLLIEEMKSLNII